MKEKIKFFDKLITKVILISIIIIVVSVSTLSFISIKKQKDTYLSEYRKRGASLCKSLASNSSYGLLTGGKEEVINITNGIFKDKDVLFAYIVDFEGHIFFYEENRVENSQSKNGHPLPLKPQPSTSERAP